ncbi:MAG: yojM, partial [Deltaproteobacteria bacterium]|nr:yojM [Deltaproteobacteria bacterium]
PHSVFADGGTALVIHDKADDGKTDPTGNAGDRIACGLITR